ncbi:hypothetical protein CAT723_10140 [Corynebacterium ammoniagenes]|uniref:LysR family transcriptional regulator n=1 Tax=Corynebacterium ammoniagenes TaxID=1697 RepID=A0AAV5G8D7_CORAM|nr:hypothetical protein CAT723_10140 [Corynebacterium ammoniagenes]
MTAPTGGLGLVVPQTSQPADIAVRKALSMMADGAELASEFISISASLLL